MLKAYKPLARKTPLRAKTGLKKTTKGLRKKSLAPLPRLRAKAWRLVSEYVRRRDQGVCFTCGKVDHWKNMDAGHFMHRDSMDYDTININTQCTRCNRFLHGNLGVYAIKLDEKHGVGTAKELERISHRVIRIDRAELESIIESYTLILKTMDEEPTNA